MLKFKYHVICTHIAQQALPTGESPFESSLGREILHNVTEIMKQIYYSCTNVIITYHQMVPAKIIKEWF